jgi:hypothetical protein
MVLKQDDNGTYLIRTPWELKCMLRRVEEGRVSPEGGRELRMALGDIQLDYFDGIWSVNPAGYHTLGPRAREFTYASSSSCLFFFFFFFFCSSSSSSLESN